MAAHDRDLEMGAIDNSGASVAAPGSYVTQMRAANNPGDGNVEGVTNKRTSPPAASPAQPNRGMPPHYGIEGEPQCCLCSKIGRLFIVTLVLGIAALIFVYIYWTDISKLNGKSSTPMGHAAALSSRCHIQLKDGVTLNPRKNFLKNGRMNWGAICDKNERSITVMRRREDSWKQLKDKARNFHNGFGDLSSSFWLGPELVKNVTCGRKWDLRIDVKSPETDFFLIYPEFTMDLVNIRLYRLKSGIPRQTNLHEVWNSITKRSSDGGPGRLSSELANEEEPLLILDSGIKSRNERGFWGGDDADKAVGADAAVTTTVKRDETTEPTGAEDEKEEEVDTPTRNETVTETSSSGDSADDEEKAMAEDEAKAEDLADDPTGPEEKGDSNDAGELINEEASVRNATSLELSETENTTASMGDEIEDEISESESIVNKKEEVEEGIGENKDEGKKDEGKKEEGKKEEGKKEEGQESAENEEEEETKEKIDLKADSVVSSAGVDAGLKKSEQTNPKECYAALLDFAMQSHCSCLMCGGKVICPSELSLTLLPARG